MRNSGDHLGTAMSTALCVALLAAGRCAGATYTYSLAPNGGIVGSGGFNNSATSEVEDNFVANSFTVVPAGTQITSVSFLAAPGSIPANQPAQVAIYLGSSLTDPHAGGGLIRVATGSATLAQQTPGPPENYTIDLAQPVTLPVGQVFYAGLLLPKVTPPSHPFEVWAFTTPLNRSFFDVGPTMGAAYNLDNTANLTVLGGVHPVLGAGVTPPGNLVLSATAIPEPGGMIIALGGGASLLLRKRRPVNIALT